MSAKAEQASLAILEKFIKLENLQGPGSGKMCSLCNSGTLHWGLTITNNNNTVYIQKHMLLIYYIEDITRWREDMNFIFEWLNNILRTSAASE